MDHSDTVRSPEQLGFDLARALQFSVADLKTFRKGILPTSSCQVLLGKVIQPILKAAAFTLLPLFGAAYYLGMAHNGSIADGLTTLFSSVSHVKELAEEQGWFRTVLYFLAALGFLGVGVYYALRIPLDLLGDIIAKRVKVMDGRVKAREEEKNAGKKRDDVITYYFEMRQCTFEVGRLACRALDSGGAYRVYYLPRSRTLVAIEPSLLAKEAEEQELKRKEQSVAPGVI